VGRDKIVEQLLIAVLVCGHCLITGLPGTAKTLMVKSLATALGLDFKRIQFTPDLMPTDVTGTDVIDVDPVSGERRWRFVQGPVFGNLLLADEINRTPPKTQAALLESMQESSVTIRGQSHELPSPFVVLATQNPIELEGTYPLPEAQLDRFLFNVVLDYLDAGQEVAVVERNTLGLTLPELESCTSARALLGFQRLVRQVPIADAVNRYAVNLVRASRPDTADAPDLVRQYLNYGASVRAAIGLSLAGRARALLAGRYHVTAEDVSAFAAPVLRHRLQRNYLAESDDVGVEEIVAAIVAAVAP
jgi:MoxR-like ATPase